MSRAGQLLLAEGLISEAALGEAVEGQRAMGGTLGQRLVRAGAIDEATLQDALCRGLGLDEVAPEALDLVRPEVAALLSAELAQVYRAVPIARDGAYLVLAMADPSDDRALGEIGRWTRLSVLPRVARESQIDRALERLFGRSEADPGAEPVAVEPVELKVRRRSSPDDPRGAEAEGGPPSAEPGGGPADEARPGFVPLTRPKKRGQVVIEIRPVSVDPEPGQEEEPSTVRERPRREARDPEDSWEPAMPALAEEVTAPGPPPASLGEAVRRLEATADRGSSVELSLAALRIACRRAAFFVVRRGIVEGLEAAGEGVDREQVRSIWIPLASPSTMREVCEGRRPRVGPVGGTRVDGIFTAALGGRRGDSVMVPVATGERVVALLYGDDLRGPAPSTSELERLGSALGAALGRLAKDKRRSTP